MSPKNRVFSCKIHFFEKPFSYIYYDGGIPGTGRAVRGCRFSKQQKKNTGMKTTEKKTTVAAGTTGAARAFTELRMRTLNGANLRFGYMPPKKVRERIDW